MVICRSLCLSFILIGLSFAGYPLGGSRYALLNYTKLKEIDGDIRNGSYGKITGLLILNSNGKIIHEKYYGFNSRSTLNQISSVTKSITSIMVGVCLEKGYINSLDTPVWEYFPEDSSIFAKDTLKKEITLRHLLTQTSGLKWDEWKFPYNYASNCFMVLLGTESNWVEKFFNLPIDTLPGTKFCYNSLASQVVAEVLSRASGLPFDGLTHKYLFEPLSIQSYSWESYPSNTSPAWGGIELTTLDMAKLGLIVINDGAPWGNRIVPESWVKLSTKKITTITDNLGYGLNWWVGKQPDGNPLVYAAGYGDQYVYTVPDKGLVIAINAQNFSDYQWPKTIDELVKSILSSISYSQSIN